MKKDVLDSAPSSGVRFEQNSEIGRLVETLASLYNRIDDDVDKLEDFRYIETATGNELDKKARPVGTIRLPGESDSDFRRRALAGRVRVTSETTYEEFAKGVLVLLDANPSDVEIFVDYQDELGAVIVKLTNQVLNNSPFSESVIVSYLEGMIPMGRRVVLRREDGFQFSSPGTTGQKQGEGFNQGVWTR